MTNPPDAHLLDNEKEMLESEIKAVNDDYQIELPESLQGLSAEELIALEKRVVRKADLVLM